MTYEYDCHRQVEGDGDQPSRCRQNAAVVSRNFDEGMCLDCLRELAMDDPKPLPLRDPLVWS